MDSLLHIAHAMVPLLLAAAASDRVLLIEYPRSKHRRTEAIVDVGDTNAGGT